jgi:hypothetical protein
LDGVGLGFLGINKKVTPSFSYLSYFDLNYQLKLLSQIAAEAANGSTSQENSDAISVATGGPAKAGIIRKQKYVSTYDSKSFNTNIISKVQDILTAGNTALAQ